MAKTTNKKWLLVLLIVPILGAYQAFRFASQWKALFDPEKIAFPTRTYTATFAKVTPEGKTIIAIVSCDGKGHMLIDQAEEKIRYLEDGPNELHVLVRKDQNVAEIYSAQHAGASFEDEDLYLSSPFAAFGIQRLGEKTIDGHECRGYRFEMTNVKPSSRTDSWFDKNTKVLVQANTVGERANASERLIKYSPQPMQPAEFLIPSGYEKADYTKTFGH